MFRTALISIALLVSVFASAQNYFREDYPDTLNKKRMWSVLGSEVGSITMTYATIHYVWYRGVERVPFTFYNDAGGYKQVDKCGHAFSCYRESYAAYYALRWAGVEKRKALWWGGPFGFVFQAPIEILDGMHKNWGFSWSDIGANAFGSALFMTQEALLDEQVVMMKFSYSPSPYPDLHPHLGTNEFESFFYDYNAHSYWLSANLRRISGFQKIPKWLNVAIGYSANGMIYEFDNPTRDPWGKPIPKLERYRQWLFSLDVDLTRIRTKKKLLKKAFRAVNMIKIPFPAIEYNRVDGLGFRPFYF